MIERINSLICQPWLMEERTAAFLYSQFLGGRLNFSDLKLKANDKALSKLAGLSAVRVGTYVYNTFAVKADNGKFVAVMPVVGTLTKRGEFCSYGMRDYMAEIAALNDNEEISATVMDMEGPGGTVDGTNEFGMAVKMSKKPIVAYGDNMVASADYWVASQARFIIGNKNNPTEFGSIGVLCMHEYWGKFIEENIGSVKIIRAPQSVDKARVNVVEELTPELEAEIKADLKVLAQTFINTVKSGRGAALKSSEEDWGTGKMFKVDESIEHGLIDAKGSLWDAINKAAELAAGGTTNKGTNNANMNRQQVAEKAASLILGGKKVKVSIVDEKKSTKGKSSAAAEETAAEDASTPPMWTEDLVFNTDGSGDGAECLHPDTDGNNRQFITKVDNNQGNEPPTDPTITEDDNWLLDNDAAEGGDGGAEEGGEEASEITTVKKMNVTLQAERKKNKDLQAKVVAFEKEKKANENKPAARATTVVTSDENGKKKAVSSWEKKACKHLGIKLEEN